jgi:hypothetical protein
MRAAAGTDTAFIEAVIRKFNQEEFFYTLQPPALGKNSTDEFLFETRQGFCEHYASAFAIMMRAAGIPARIVLGYHGGEPNPISGHMTVRQSDAHAWNEVWIDGNGWYRIDPTGAVAPERIDSGVSDAAFDGVGAAWGFRVRTRLAHNLTIAMDALDAKWNEWILGYGPENQNKFMNWMGMQDPSWRKLMLTLIAVVAIIVVLISLLLTLRYRSPAKDPAAILYQRFARKTGLEPEIGETAERFAERVRNKSALPATAIDSVTHAYHEARYGPEENSDDSLLRLKAAVAAIGPSRSAMLSAQ